MPKKAASKRAPRAVVEIGLAAKRKVERLAKAQNRTQKQIMATAINDAWGSHLAEQKRLKGFDEVLG